MLIFGGSPARTIVPAHLRLSYPPRISSKEKDVASRQRQTEAGWTDQTYPWAGRLHRTILECSAFGRKVTAVCQELRKLYPRFPILAVGVDKSLDYMVALLDAGAGDYTILPLAERLLAARLPSAIRRFRTPGTWCSRTFRGWINRARCSQRSCREIGSPGSVVSYGISRARSVNASTWYSDLAFCTRSKRFHPVVRGPASATAPGWAIRQSRTE